LAGEHPFYFERQKRHFRLFYLNLSVRNGQWFPSPVGLPSPVPAFPAGAGRWGAGRHAPDANGEVARLTRFPLFSVPPFAPSAIVGKQEIGIGFSKLAIV